MSTILVTGGAGYIGSHTCKALAAQGYTPVVYDNLSEGHAEFVHWGPLVEGELRDEDCLRATFVRFRPTAVIHFAASAYVGESMKDPQSYYENNVAGSLSLLNAMREESCENLVFSSTCAVYGEPEALPISSQTPTAPINPYGRSKLMVEQIIADCGRAFGINSAILRYFNAAGADADGEIGERHIPETHLIPNAINAALEPNGELSVYGKDYPTHDGTCVRDYIHVSDLADGHIKALRHIEEFPGSHVFNLGAGKGISISQLIREVEDQTGRALNVRWCPRRAGDPAELVADIQQSMDVLEWQPNNSTLPEIVRTALAWATAEKADIGNTY